LHDSNFLRPNVNLSKHAGGLQSRVSGLYISLDLISKNKTANPSKCNASIIHSLDPELLMYLTYTIYSSIVFFCFGSSISSIMQLLAMRLKRSKWMYAISSIQHIQSQLPTDKFPHLSKHTCQPYQDGGYNPPSLLTIVASRLIAAIQKN
jgi:hypothetical protein